MSKHEPRAAQIKISAALLGLTISWSRRGSKIFVHIKQPSKNTFVAAVAYEHTKAWLQIWYPNVDMTSWTTTHGTFKVFDIWEELKK